MAISIQAPASLRGLDPGLRAIILKTFNVEGRHPGEIAIVLTGDEELRRLNHAWRGLDRATDVLSFSYDETGPGETVRPQVAPARATALRPARETRRGAPGRGTPEPEQAPSRRRPRVNGDLVISIDRMREQAGRFRASEGEELARLVIHGALHLAGLDHRRAAERRHMRAREEAVLRVTRGAIRLLDRVLRRV